MTLPTTKPHGAHMGEIYADLTLTNVFQKKSVRIRALVDTGTKWMVITPAVAKELGYDIEELETRNVALADGSRRPFPEVSRSLELRFHPEPDAQPDRDINFPAIVMGDQCLMGHMALQALDLIVDFTQHRVKGQHEGGAVYRA